MNMSKTRSQAGYTLVGVLFIFVLLSVLGLSITTLAVTSFQNSSKEELNQSAFYIAESGINKRMEEVVEQIKEIHKKDTIKNDTDFYDDLQNIVDESGVKYSQFEKTNNVQPEAMVTIHRIENTENEFKMESIGKIRDESRKLATKFTVGWGDSGSVGDGSEGGEGGSGNTGNQGDDVVLPPFAIFTKGKLEIKNGTINGNFSSTSEENDSIVVDGGPTINGDAYVIGGNELFVNAPNRFKLNIEELDENYSFPDLPPFPEIPQYVCPEDDFIHKDNSDHYFIKDCNLNITNYATNLYELKVEYNLKFNSINLDENNTLYINMENGNKSIVVDHLNITNGHIKLIGDGAVTFYVTGKITMGAGSTINNSGNKSSVNIFYDGNEDINLHGNTKIFGSIFSNSYDANINMGASGEIHGNIFTNAMNIQLNGAAASKNQIILAPNAHTKFANGIINGRIYSSSYLMDGGAQIIYSEDLDIEGPLSIEELYGNSGDQKPDSFTIKRESIIEIN